MKSILKAYKNQKYQPINNSWEEDKNQLTLLRVQYMLVLCALIQRHFTHIISRNEDTFPVSWNSGTSVTGSLKWKWLYQFYKILLTRPNYQQYKTLH